MSSKRFQLTSTIPEHLRAHIVEQDYSKYTWQDQASWRMIMRISKDFFSQHAHKMYLEGLGATGICADRIPRISEMDQAMQKFGWRAVAVSGFILPAAFLEFLSLGILPIACDMRKIENLNYTPSPDIVHEAAGHAPIIADPDYATYLREYGLISRKVIFSDRDMNLYFAIRRLSDVKENPWSTAPEIASAQVILDQAVASMGEPSEAAFLARMSWWTIEYGLIGEAGSPKIYGAGLLSSLGESFHCYDESVKKLPLTLDCIRRSYDITNHQPQLYVAKSFAHMSELLQEFAQTLSFNRGGISGLKLAQRAHLPTTTVLETGLQISGRLVDFKISPLGSVCFLKFDGPVQLSLADRELAGQSAKVHGSGFSSPLDRELAVRLNAMEDNEIRALQELKFFSGIVLTGRVKSLLRQADQLLMITWAECKIVDQDGASLYRPEWGDFDLALGGEIVSVFGGVADQQAYLAVTGEDFPGIVFEAQVSTAKKDSLEENLVPQVVHLKHKSNLRPENEKLDQIYHRVRQMRDLGTHSAEFDQEICLILEELAQTYPDEWLIRFEIYELLQSGERQLSTKLIKLRSQLKDFLSAIMKGTMPQSEILKRAWHLISV